MTSASEPFDAWPGGVDGGAVAASCPSWAACADDADQFELALALLDAGDPQRLDGDDVAVARARLLLLARRPIEAVAVLRARGFTDLPDTLSGPYLVLAASLAAAGDRQAYRRLLAVAGSAAAGGSWQVAYLVAAAAGQLGEHTTADQAWTNIVVRHRIVTTATVSQLAAAEVAARDQHDPVAATSSVLTAAQNLAAVEPPADRYPGPVLDAAANLRDRGDTGGARLLLEAATRLLPPTPAITAELHRLTPAAAMRRHRRRLAALSVLTAVVVLSVAVGAAVTEILPLGAVGVVVGLAAQRGWRRWAPVPGLDRTDSATWRVLRTIPRNPRRGPADTTTWDHSSVYAAAAAIGLITAALVASGIGDTLTAGPGPTPTATRALLAVIWAVLLTTIPAASYLTVRHEHRRILQRRRDRRHRIAEQQRLRAVQRCSCWQTRYLAGDDAAHYLHAHLTPLAPAPIASIIGAATARCPSTGALWLAVPAGTATTILLRAELNPQPGPDPRPGPTGLYL